MKFTNRKLEKAFGFSFPQVKRWAVACLGRDPEADYAGGAHREYSLDDAYKIFIMGRLVTEYRFVLKEAKDHIENIWPIFAEEALLPSQNWDRSLDGTYQVRYYLTIYASMPTIYELERIISIKEIKRTHNKVVINRQSEIITWPKGCNTNISVPQYIISVYRLLWDFISEIKKVV